MIYLSSLIKIRVKFKIRLTLVLWQVLDQKIIATNLVKIFIANIQNQMILNRHQKLGHANFKTLKNLCKFEAVRGLPNLWSLSKR